ncbi:LacI family transcriptional regulator [Fodinisporobacter ferrooxydans]|uniref:LacI family transcriptional regulator n=1 Tax=Fodinisporobacter ferrooxydans TaxID=2901836 RepID=A0ABY4CLK8_9BACL|nr:LacI family transcriptional regulator [Alicyclobacillaceae bacterium MYW30-H2]
MERKPTIKDIAKLAGVTPATVSYVLNGNNRVSEETRKRVLSVVRQLNYRPNMSARALVRNRSYRIGLFIPMSPRAFLDPFFAELLRGLTEVALAYRYVASIIYANGLREVESLHIRELVDGLVITEIKMHDEYIRYFYDKKIPFVSLGRGSHKHFEDYVVADAKKGIREAMKYLYRLGHRRIGMVLGPLGYEYIQERYRFFREVQEELGLSFSSQYIATGANSQEGGKEGARRIMLRSTVKPTAILASTDIMAVGVIEFLQSVGYQVPDDLSVVGYDDVQFSKYIRPSLTTIRQNVYEIGRQAGTMLISQLEHLPYKKPLQIPVKLVVRNSTTVNKENL